jgi:hypothetical protein
MISGNLLVTLGKARPPSEVVWNREALTRLGKAGGKDSADLTWRLTSNPDIATIAITNDDRSDSRHSGLTSDIQCTGGIMN